MKLKTVAYKAEYGDVLELEADYLLTREDLRQVWEDCKKSFVRPDPEALKSGLDEWCEMSQTFDEWLAKCEKE